MQRSRLGMAFLGFSFGTVLAGSALAQSATEAERYWGQWRGPLATGVSETANSPISME